MKLLLVLLGLASIATCLENGVAITPPMGWNSWNHFACNVDCDNDPENCISEYLIKSIADAMVSTGLVNYGYEYINIDDCWPAKQRDSRGRLYADPKRFPSGMKALVDYVHSKGLKFGIYEDVGYNTCGMYPGSEGNETTDANTFIEWGVDYLKLDGCWFPLDLMPAKYSEWSLKLAKSQRPVVYSCSWPTYANVNNASVDYNLVGTVCNLWRAWWDITDSWDSVEFIIDWWATSGIQPYGGPGKWNDMDMLEVGNGNMSNIEYKSHFSLWSIMAAPLIMGADIRNLDSGAYQILTAKEVIAVDQDPLGIQGNRVWKDGDSEIWSKLLHDGSMAVVLLNRDTKPTSISVPWDVLGWPEDSTALVRDLWQKKDLGSYPGAFEADVLGHGVVMIKATLMAAEKISM